jgi:hypothetical protein
LDWHRRENKSAWWRFYELMGMSEDELVDEAEPIGLLEFVKVIEPGGRVRGLDYRYKFPSQEHKIEIGSDVIGAVALERGDALLDEKVAHRRIDVLIGSANVVAATLEQGGERRHGGPAHTNQVDALGAHGLTAASSITSDGRGEVSTRARTPNGSVSVGPSV